MKLFVLHTDIYGPLQAVSRSIAVKPQLPVLSNVLIQTEKDYLKISATNLEIGVIKKIRAEVLEEGEITIPAKIFAEIINSLSGERICLESSADQLKISTENFSGVLNGIAATEFPTIPLSSEKSITINGELLHTSLPEISYAAAIDEARPILTGILTQIKDHTIEFVATDGFRLAHKKMTLPKENSLNFKALIPRRTFEEVVKLINEDLKGEKSSEISISTSDNQNQMIFTIGSTQLSSRLIEGNYPVWEKIVPQTFVTTSVIDRADLIKAIKLAAVFSRDAANIVKLNVEKDKIKVLSEARELGQQETDLEVTSEGEQLQISFNNKYLLDALSNCTAKEVTIKFSGNLSPALIVPNGEDGLEYVVMPIRTS
jgi:DNA polymerase III subunit beta